ncbi:porin [Rhodoferax sp.]|uniref:porin n=1 Tax=Rhodoferax sp. TaxID=50421 RepID=UPI0019EA9772|nr:porin [Rhodoferax sp.]MBE0475432.1 porin [Rhodoferax sp.]
MKKSLVALAVLAASGAAFAQSNVTVYGIADVWFGSVKGEISGADAEALEIAGSARQTVLESGGVNSSRWGLMGSEDLGGGLKANFNLEQGFSVDTGAAADTSKAFSKQAWVGVSGGFGEAKLGLTGTAYDDIRGLNNNTFDSALAAVPWVDYIGTGSNQIYYALPDMGGFAGALSYALGEGKDVNVSAGSVLSLNVQYAQGPFMVGFAHQKEKTDTKLGLGALDGINDLLIEIGADTVAEDIRVATAGSTAKYNLLTGSYDLGVAKLLASYNTVKITVPDITDSLKAKEFQVGADIPLSSAMTLAVGYGQSKWEEEINIAKRTAFSAAVNYSMSKRTSVYAGFNNTKLDADADVADIEVKTTIFAVGLNHKF